MKHLIAQLLCPLFIEGIVYARYWLARNLSKQSVFALAGNARKNRDGIVSKSIIYFTQHVPETNINCPEPLKLRKILDMVCRVVVVRYL